MVCSETKEHSVSVLQSHCHVLTLHFGKLCHVAPRSLHHLNLSLRMASDWEAVCCCGGHGDTGHSPEGPAAHVAPLLNASQQPPCSHGLRPMSSLWPLRPSRWPLQMSSAMAHAIPLLSYMLRPHWPLCSPVGVTFPPGAVCAHAFCCLDALLSPHRPTRLILCLLSAQSRFP